MLFELAYPTVSERDSLQVEILFRKADAESVGELLCQRARELHVVALVMGRY